MSDDTIERANERLRMGRAARESATATPAASPRAGGLRGSDLFPVGARVFEQLAAKEGIVVAAPAGASSRAGSVFVQFDSGVTSACDPRYLMRRPIPPGVRT